jgi:glycosyltransferase involved in cell wall biosynthesis
MTEPVVHLIVGPDRHGVVRFGVDLDAALGAVGYATVQRRTLDSVPAGRGVHLQFTDRLFGADARQAVAAVTELVALVHREGGRVTATLHDLPQPTDRAIRTQAYVALCSILDGIVVSSDHERHLLCDIGIRGGVTVIPLPITAPTIGSEAPIGPVSVGVFGFLYPGKGHAEVLEAMAGLPAAVAMLALGEPSAGHGDLVDGLDTAARAQNRTFIVTGHLPDDGLIATLQAVTVPVVAHRQMSASGSLNSWISAGRRPLVPATRYVREIADRNPGALWLYDDRRGALSAALHAAMDDPASTWLAPGTVCSPTPWQAAESYRQLLVGVHG